MAPVGGVDIGGTKIRWVVIRRGRVVFAREVRTPRNKERFTAALGGIFHILQRRGVRRTGVGFPGTVHGTKVVSARNTPFMNGTDIGRAAPKGMSVTLDNDARCFARAEAKRGAGRGARRLLALIFGTGIGRGFAQNGEVLRLTRFSRPERWEGAYQNRLSLPPPVIARFLAKELAPLIAEMAPDAVVLGGGIMRKPHFFTLLRRGIRKESIHVTVRRSRLRQNGPAIGAALMVGK